MFSVYRLQFDEVNINNHIDSVLDISSDNLCLMESFLVICIILDIFVYGFNFLLGGIIFRRWPSSDGKYLSLRHKALVRASLCHFVPCLLTSYVKYCEEKLVVDGRY